MDTVSDTPIPIPDPLARARERVQAVARDRRQPLPPALVEEAAQLLDKLWLAGLEHDIDPDDWGNVTSLPSAVVDVLTIWRGHGGGR